MTCRNCKTTIRTHDRRIYCLGPNRVSVFTDRQGQKIETTRINKVWFCGKCGDNDKIVDRVMNDIEKKAKGK